jgi:hypothetical protein
MSLNAQRGLIHLASQHSVEETMQRLEAVRWSAANAALKRRATRTRRTAPILKPL